MPGMNDTDVGDSQPPGRGLDAARAALGATLARCWGLESAGPEQVLRLAGGARAVLRVPCTGRDVVAKLHVPPRPAAAREMALLVLLRERTDLRAHLLEPIPTKAGELCVEFAGASLTLTVHLLADGPQPSVALWAQLGALTARLHAVELGELAPGSGSAFTFAPVRAELVADAPPGPDQEAYRRLLANLPDLDASPTALIHTDLAPSNVLATGDGTVILTDFDDLGLGPRVFDLGFPLLCWFHDGDVFDEASALAFYGAYGARHRLDAQERALIVDAGIFYACMYWSLPQSPGRLRAALWAAGPGRAVIERVLARAWDQSPGGS